MQWRQAGETRFATPVSRISGLPRAGILRFTARLGISLQTGLPYAGIWPAAWLRISVRTGLLRPLEPAIRAGQRLIAPSPECPRPAPQHRRDRLARIRRGFQACCPETRSATAAATRPAALQTGLERWGNAKPELILR